MRAIPATSPARSVVVLVEERDAARASPHAGRGAEVLGPLAAAAGIAPDWWDVGGARHVVTADTKRALLAAMGLAASSTAEVRERLAELAGARRVRRLPPAIVARATPPSSSRSPPTV